MQSIAPNPTATIPSSNLNPTPRRNSVPITLTLPALQTPRTPIEKQRAATRCLREWFLQHLGWPYPDQREKARLAEACGPDNVIQIGTWFTNTRNRSGWLTMFKELAEEDRDVMEELIRVATSPTECKDLADHVMAQINGVVKKLSDIPPLDVALTHPEFFVKSFEKTRKYTPRRKNTSKAPQKLPKKKSPIPSSSGSSCGLMDGDFSDSASDRSSSIPIELPDQKIQQNYRRPLYNPQRNYQNASDLHFQNQYQRIYQDSPESQQTQLLFTTTSPMVYPAQNDHQYHQHANRLTDIELPSTYALVNEQAFSSFQPLHDPQHSTHYFTPSQPPPQLNTFPYAHPISIDGSTLAQLIQLHPQQDENFTGNLGFDQYFSGRDEEYMEFSSSTNSEPLFESPGDFRKLPGEGWNLNEGNSGYDTPPTTYWSGSPKLGME